MTGSGTRRPARTAVVAAALLALATGCGREPARAPVPVTVVGVDGADWRVIDPLLERGELPALARLLARGARGPLRSQMPLVSPPVWTTIATGVSRERHGITGFTVPGRVAMSIDRRVPALWTLASRAGLRSAVVGWWATYPAESIAGVVVSERTLKLREDDLRGILAGRGGEARLGNLVHPPDVLPVLQQILAPAAPPDGPLARALGMRAEDGSVARALRRLREHAGPFPLELVLMRGVDVVSHHYWRFHEPDAPVYTARERPTAEEVERLGAVVRDHYRYVDGLLADLVRADGATLVVSDHGFEAGRQPLGDHTLSGTHQSAAALDGILVASGAPFRAGARIAGASIRDVAPTVLHLLALPVPEGLEGRVLTDLFDPGWLAAHPVRAGPAFTGIPVDAVAPSAPAMEERLRQELRALGYIQ